MIVSHTRPPQRAASFVSGLISPCAELLDLFEIDPLAVRSFDAENFDVPLLHPVTRRLKGFIPRIVFL
jgi:hypothetical protein